ncbi:MAG: UDP-N-acetylglucosamine 2-epimerase (non-hydrolyzing) [Chitinophagales bacterium]|nr:UDP-N-acetylglucosamine 2-epimerase (non-hydrolyzing) [Chitinophagales bacterium]
MKLSKIVVVIGARPQFIKHAALELELKKHFDIITIHTGQHYDTNMSHIFFDQLGISKPQYLLNIGSANHGLQTAKMMIEIENILINEKPQFMIVYGDTNSTLAGALVASKLNIKIIHIEAELRSYNRQMPEEINRILCDHLSELLFCPSQIGIENLRKEGIINHVFDVGDIMVDMQLLALNNQMINENNDKDSYYFATIHRSYNTDNKNRLLQILESFQGLKKKVKFAVHPRTLHKINSWCSDISYYNNIVFLPPLSYFDSLNMQYNSSAVITDSGGMQKEAYLFKKKCITIRTETEWVETLEGNWSKLVFENLNNLQNELDIIPTKYNNNLYGDGKTAKKIVEKINRYNL